MILGHKENSERKGYCYAKQTHECEGTWTLLHAQTCKGNEHKCIEKRYAGGKHHMARAPFAKLQNT
jgi:hypothetical protein